MWGTTKSNYNKILVLQKRILRIFSNFHGDYANLKTAPLFNRFSVLRADQVYYMKVLRSLFENKALLQQYEEAQLFF